jgi:hypothetical protein
VKNKLPFVIFFLLAALSLAFWGYLKAMPDTDSQTGGLPRIEISPKDFDFGQIKYGEVVKHVFKIQNSGKGVLKIKKLATSCGCTTVEIAKEVLAAGEEVELLVTYDSGAMTGSHARGEQERIIYIRSNDPTSPQIEAKIYANVR